VDAPAAGKRKRDAAQDDDDEENQAPDAEEEESDAQLEDDDDDEDVVEEAVPKRKRPSQGVKGKRPASKRSKTNGTAPAARQTAIPSRPKKAVRIDIERRDGDGLFG
jgi:cohesin complex subunit SA-1/2